jgi:Predicted nucleoside-diphosphate-sugar epimerases
MAKAKLIAVIGGSGFVGRHVVQALAREGHRVRVGVRHVERASFLKPMGVPGQVVPMQANVRFPNSLKPVVAGADVVINLVGILQESGPQKFTSLQAEVQELLQRPPVRQRDAIYPNIGHWCRPT